MTTKIKILAKSLTIICIIFISSCTKKPVPCFLIDKGKQTKVNEEIQFDGTCSTNTINYLWDFGDGSIESGSTTKHKYKTAGTYVVTLTASNKSKSATSSQNLTITP